MSVHTHIYTYICKLKREICKTSHYRQISATLHYSQYLSMKQVMPKPLSPKPFPTFFLISFQNQKSLMKPGTFDFKSLPAFQLQLYPLHHLVISPHMPLNRKTQKTVSV